MPTSTGTGKHTGHSADVTSGTATAPAAATTIGSKPAAGGEGGALAPIVYPVLAFSGTGYVTANQRDHLHMSSSLETSLTDSELVVTTKNARIECGSVVGCNQGKVDGQVQQSLGATTYQRVSGAQLTSLAAGGFKNEGFALYASGIQGVSGVAFTFDKPLPVFPWPAAASRYNDLGSGPMTWSATAVANQPITTLDQPVSQMSVSVTVERAGGTGTQVILRLRMTIAEDRDGTLYRAFPMPATATYTIDTATQTVLTLQTVGRTYSDETQSQEQSDLSYALCSKTLPGQQATRFPCPGG